MGAAELVDELGDTRLLTSVLGGAEDIGPMDEYCAAAVIARVAVAAPTNRRDPYMLLLISTRQILPGDRVPSRRALCLV